MKGGLSPEQWLDRHHELVESGRFPVAPETIGQLRIAEQSGLLKRHPSWRPGKEAQEIINWFIEFGRR